VPQTNTPIDLERQVRAQNTKPVPQKTWRCGFQKAKANDVDSDFLSIIRAGAGMTINQTAGSLVLTSGTTAYDETILRSTCYFWDNWKLRYFLTLSQRIVNHDVYVELVDVVGDNLAFTMTSATVLVVTWPTGKNPFTADNVGQSVYLGNFSLASCLSGRYAIASVSGDTTTFTVVAFPSSGSGTLSIFGKNYYHVLYTNTTTTNANFDAQAEGYNSGDTVATINTSTTGHEVLVSGDGARVAMADGLGASFTALDLTYRAGRNRNVPVDDVPLFLQVRVVNGSPAPATTTTTTIGFIEMDQYVAQQVSLVNTEPMSSSSPLQVTLQSSSITSIATSVVPGTAATNLGKAEDAVSASGDTGVFVLGVRRDALTQSASATGDYSEIAVDMFGSTQVTNFEKRARTYSASTIASHRRHHAPTCSPSQGRPQVPSW
jgi:hypothetical protein